MKVIIAGSRSATFENVLNAVSACHFSDDATEFVSGGARGADSFGEQIAKDSKIPIKRFIPDWNKHGKAAGIIRNCEMAGYADALIAVWDGKSRGTAHMIQEAVKKKLQLFVYTF